MLEILATWVYIFITSYCAGYLCINALSKLSGTAHKKQPAVLYSIAGLLVIMVLGGYLSIFFPTGIIIHILLISISLLFLLQNKGQLRFPKSNTGNTYLFLIQYLVLAAVVCLILLKSSGPITTPDSAGYHLPFIKWIEHYKAVKGIANVHTRFGFNYQYHVLCAIYGMAFLKIPTLHAMNGYLMVALMWYMLRGMRFFTTKQLSKYDLFCVIAVLFVFNMSNATSSFSPDFPTTAMIMFAILLFIRRTEEGIANRFDTNAILIFLITIGAILFKISSLPVVLLNLYFFIPMLLKRQWKQVGLVIVLGLVAVTPYLIRNYIISGYLVYPLYSLDIFNVPWKVPFDKVVAEKEVVRTYALGLEYGQRVSFSDSISSWWQYLRATNRVYIYIIGLLGASVVLNLVWMLLIFIRGKSKEYINHILLFGLLYLCLIYWWLNAPDPRFGNGYIISFIALTITLCFYKLFEKLKAVVFYGAMALLVVLALGMMKGQSLSKVDNNFKGMSYNFITQEPYPKTELITRTNEKNQVFYKPPQDCFCWDAPQPCMFYNDTCLYIGNTIDEGFLPVK